MKITEKPVEVQFFAIGVVSTPLSSWMSNKLGQEIPLMYCLLNIGKLHTTEENEYIFGVSLTQELRPTLSLKREMSDATVYNDLSAIACMNLPALLRGKMLHATKENLFWSDLREIPGGKTLRRIAVCMPLEPMKEIRYSLEEGHGILIERQIAKEILEKMESRRKREQKKVLITHIGSGEKRFKLTKPVLGNLFIIVFAAQNAGVSKDSFSLRFGGHLGEEIDMLTFVNAAMTKFSANIRAERLAAWEKSSRTIIAKSAKRT